MTFCAAQGRGQPDTAGITDTISHVFCKEFLGLGSTFPRGQVQSVVGRRDTLLARGAWKQVSSELFTCEMIKGHVLVEGLDDPIAVGIHVPGIVGMDPGGAAKPDQVKPVGRHAFPVAGRREECFNFARVVFP